jgi:transglutaminase-like putative cysteine protease
MLIRLAYDIQFEIPTQVAMVALLNIHPSRIHDLIEPDELQIEPRVPVRMPMDFSAWFEAWLDGRWWTFDARNNQPRIGRILMATDRDASDVAMTTAFGRADLTHFFVVTEEEAGTATRM